MMYGNISTMEVDEQEQIEENNKKFLYARAVHANHMIQRHMQEIIECQRVVDEYRSMVDGKRELIPLESDLFKRDPVINQHIMQMIDTNILWFEKTFRGILVELQKIRNGKMVTHTSEEHGEKETINHYDESHATFDDLWLYKGEKTQQDYDDMKSISVTSEAQKNWPRKCFQINKNKNYESAMMCWESLEDSEQEERTRKMIHQDEEMNNDKEKQDDKKDDEEHAEGTVCKGN